jgi:hypothetical protein
MMLTDCIAFDVSGCAYSVPSFLLTPGKLRVETEFDRSHLVFGELDTALPALSVGVARLVS